MEKGGTYIVAGVMVGGGKLYLQCFKCSVVSFVFGLLFCFFNRSRGVRWVMCMGRRMRDVCFRTYIWREFQIFCLAGCFMMGR